MQSHRKKILVALSGGVDSAVAAALLKEQGHEVVGVFFDFGSWSDVSKVRKIAKTVGIPLKIVNARKEFKKKVIDYFVNAYKSGITPNPCVACNKEIKFDLLLSLLKKEKADFVATGHYARIISVIASVAKQSRELQTGSGLLRRCAPRNDNYKLLEARDKSKDQSYFLYHLTQKELAKIVFPLGDHKKTEVKKIAKKLELPVAREESQDICFLPDRDIVSFLEKKIKAKSGNIVDERGNILGKHEGLPFYTIGQRRRIEAGGLGPHFVIGKNARRNELAVSNDPKRLLTKKFEVRQVNWVCPRAKLPARVRVQIRYHAPKISATIRKVGSGRWEVRSGKTLRAVTPGQSAVFYRRSEVLGGGIIVS